MRLYLFCHLAFTLWLTSANALEPGRNLRSRNNLFDPIYAYDDIDAHTVSAGFQPEPIAPTLFGRKPAITAPVSNPKVTSTKPTPGPNVTSFGLRRIQSSLPLQQQQKPQQSTISESRVIKRTSLVSAPTPENNWSALENYYKKLGLSSQQASQLPVQPTYQVVQEDQDERLNPLKSLQGVSQPPYSTFTQIGSGSNPFRASPTASSRNPAFLFPVVDQFSPTAPTSQKVDQSDYDALMKLYLQTLVGSGQTRGQSSASASRPILLSTSTLQQQQQQQQQPQPQQQVTQQQYQLQLPQYTRIPQNFNYSPPSQPSTLVSSAGFANNKQKYLEWRKLPELLLIQQHQQRLKHQQETFGPTYDQQRIREEIQEEVFCGPRNQIAMYRSSSPVSTALSPSTLKSLAKIQYDSLSNVEQLRTQLERLDETQAVSQDGPGLHEYPSHVGIYNGTTPETDNYLCSATWIHERFALTVASCLRQVLDPKLLTVRIGEWNLNKNSTPSLDRSMTTRKVKLVHLFPRYRNDSQDHNLALVEFSAPVEFLDMPYVCPACQMQSRTSLKSNSCWTPVRNITTVQYFDAEGEGETKERKEVSMIEVPVKLIANDELECQRKTGISFFNYQHPNYICSEDLRTSPWRQRLNQTSNFGSGIYCNENGQLSLVSLLHPVRSNTSSTFGFLDITYYKPWIRGVVSGRGI